jgi:hypothetical protein
MNKVEISRTANVPFERRYSGYMIVSYSAKKFGFF